MYATHKDHQLKNLAITKVETHLPEYAALILDNLLDIKTDGDILAERDYYIWILSSDATTIIAELYNAGLLEIDPVLPEEANEAKARQRIQNEFPLLVDSIFDPMWGATLPTDFEDLITMDVNRIKDWANFVREKQALEAYKTESRYWKRSQFVSDDNL